MIDERGTMDGDDEEEDEDEYDSEYEAGKRGPTCGWNKAAIHTNQIQIIHKYFTDANTSQIQILHRWKYFTNTNRNTVCPAAAGQSRH